MFVLQPDALNPAEAKEWLTVFADGLKLLGLPILLVALAIWQMPAILRSVAWVIRALKGTKEKDG